MWAVYDELDDVHVMPLFGPDHEFSADCWCHPREDDEGKRPVIIHEAAH